MTPASGTSVEDVPTKFALKPRTAETRRSDYAAGAAQVKNVTWIRPVAPTSLRSAF